MVSVLNVASPVRVTFPELASKITSSELVGTPASAAPPDVVDQFAAVLQPVVLLRKYLRANQ